MLKKTNTGPCVTTLGSKEAAESVAISHVIILMDVRL